jgi:hypothetical protein
VSPAHRRYLLVEQGIGSAAFNFVLNAAIAWVAFRHLADVPLWGAQSIAGDTVGTAFLLPFCTGLIVTRMARGHVRAGRIEMLDGAGALARLPAGTVARSLALGIACAATVAPVILLALIGLGIDTMGLGRFVVLKAAFAAALAAVVTPVLAAAALLARPA